MPSPRRVPRGRGKELPRSAPLPFQTHAVPSRRYTPSTEKPLLPPAAVRLRSRPTHSRSPSASLSLCGAPPGGAGPPPLRGGRRPTVWREALLGAVCVRACVRVLRRVRVSEARAPGSSGQGRAGQGRAWKGRTGGAAGCSVLASRFPPVWVPMRV